MTKQVMIDTNFFMVPYSLGIDLFSELERLLPGFEPVTLSSVVDELLSIKKTSGKDAIAASIGLQLIEKRGIGIINSHMETDDAIVELASRGKIPVCTNDTELKRRLIRSGVRVICVRGKGLSFI